MRDGRADDAAEHPALELASQRGGNPPALQGLARETRIHRTNTVTLLCQMARPAPPGHQCPGYVSTEKPGEPGSWRSGSDFGAGFSRLFVSGVAAAFMPGRGGPSNQVSAGDLPRPP